MKIKTCLLVFANPMIEIGPPYYDHICEAIEHSKNNLLARYGIKVLSYSLKNGGVIIKLCMKDEVPFKNLGYHLRGITLYLYRTYPDTYKPMKYQNRLFHYIPAGTKTEVKEPKRVCVLVELVHVDDSKEDMADIRRDIRSILQGYGYSLKSVTVWSKKGRITDIKEE